MAALSFSAEQRSPAIAAPASQAPANTELARTDALGASFFFFFFFFLSQTGPWVKPQPNGLASSTWRCRSLVGRSAQYHRKVEQAHVMTVIPLARLEIFYETMTWWIISAAN
jgi:hypothetical protein